MSKITDLYYGWLLEKISGNHPIQLYSNLFSVLHSTNFRWVLPMDANRNADGIDIRDTFVYENNLCGKEKVMLMNSFESDRCTLLEMMVSLAERMNNYGGTIECNSSDIFWYMLYSSGLNTFNDDNFDIGEVMYIIDNMLDRNYEPTGAGGFFKFRANREDIRTVEIWVQAKWYLTSNM